VNSVTIHSQHANAILEILGEVYQTAPPNMQQDIKRVLEAAFSITPDEAYTQACQRLVDEWKKATGRE